MTSSEAHAEVLEAGRRVRITRAGGGPLLVSALWLFDHADEAREPVSGQRRHGALELDEAKVVSAEISGDRLVLLFAAGERRLPLSRLGDGGLARPPRALWLTSEPIDALSPVPFDAYLADDSALAEALTRVARFGLAVLTGAGDDPGAVERAVARFGFVRETNYGHIFDVRVEVEPGNFAFTERALDLHTDNPYRDPVPTLQLLHAIRSDPADGGATTFVDGFAHAEALRREAPGAFEALSREPVCFTFADTSGAAWSARFPLLETDARGALQAVRVNHRSLDLEAAEVGQMEVWYEAYLSFYRRLHAPEAAFEKRLATGELILFDNRRILHGRRAFAEGGARWLRGAYAEADGMYATLARLGA